jgi:transposase
MDIHGFVYEASSCVYRKTGEDDPDDAAGTIDQARFEHFVEFNLVPHLGNYALGEPRSIVVLDNCTTHTGQRVRDLIECAGAILLFTAPRSPDLSPIEYCFHVYKAALKRSITNESITSVEMAHLHAVQAVTADIARNQFRHSLCGAIRNVPEERGETAKTEEVLIIAAAFGAVVAVLSTCGGL